MKRESLKTLRKVIKYIGAYRYLLFLSILLAAVTVALTLYVPILLGDAIDCILENGVDFETLKGILIKVTITAILTALLQWLMNFINNKMVFEVVRDVRNDAVDKITRLPLSYIDKHPAGEIVSRVIGDAEQFADGLLLGFTQLFTGVMTILGTLIFMLVMRAEIALVVVIITPLSLFVASFIAKRTYSLFHTQSEIRGEQTGLMNETVENQKVVAAFSYEDKVTEKFEEINGRLEKAAVKATFFSSLVNPTTRFVNSVVYAVVALVGALMAVDGLITVGMLSCFLSYANQYTKPFNEISGVITEMENALACAARLFKVIEAEPESENNSNILTGVDGKVDIENVDFSYTDKPLIENLNLHVEPSTRVAIVGPTGCGKTTLINLLMRFYDVKSGSIKVDGTDIREINRTSLRKNYGMVLQDTWLRVGTVRDNIVMGKRDASEEEIEAAARTTHAHSFIKRLPNGYDTVIGEDGGGLSAGQKQLLCIARIMLSKPPMLILDEATSSIDTRTEMKIQDAFSIMMEGRTSFIVAHRLSTIKNADLILVMKDGNVVESGNHKELMEKDGFYAYLYKSRMTSV